MTTFNKEAFASELTSLCNKYGVIIEGGLDFSIIVRGTSFETSLTLEPSFYRDMYEDLAASELYMWEILE